RTALAASSCTARTRSLVRPSDSPAREPCAATVARSANSESPSNACSRAGGSPSLAAALCPHSAASILVLSVMLAHQFDARHVARAEQHERRLDAGVAVQHHGPSLGQAA